MAAGAGCAALHKTLLVASLAAYLLSLAVLMLLPRRRQLAEARWFSLCLSLGIACHAAYTLYIALWLGRPPFFGKTELLSWFAFGCAAICLATARQSASRFVTGWGVACSSCVLLWLTLTCRSQAMPDVAALRGFTAWWHGFATPLGCAAGFMAFAAQLRALPLALRARRVGRRGRGSADDEVWSSLALGLVRLGYPLLLSGLVVLLLGSLDAVGRAWFWQRSLAAQLFSLVVYTVYLHLSASEQVFRTRMFLVQTAAFCGVLACVLSFDLPQGLLRALGLGLFL
ncbi:MAG: hypothetical protein JW952_01210 [Candidatus Eisenbacteria bacterium]|nr:hypothetical protein [Candidatus Eisenbacteria bacterium]